jgi:hypothetical protein
MKMRWWLKEIRNENKIFVGEPEGKRLLGRPTCRWKYNTIMDLKEL